MSEGFPRSPNLAWARSAIAIAVDDDDSLPSPLARLRSSSAIRSIPRDPLARAEKFWNISLCPKKAAEWGRMEGPSVSKNFFLQFTSV